MAKPPETLASGVTLPDWDDFDYHRAKIFDATKSAVAGSFPQSYNGVRLELHDLHYEDPEHYSNEEQKQALMNNKFLSRRLRGHYKLFDEKTGDLLDHREATVMRVPYLTDRGTFLHGGSEYTTNRQARLQPGAYTRRKANGETETHFNARRNTGHSFRVHLEPESGLMKMEIGQSSLRLYSLLHDLGVPDEEMEKRWGPELLKSNREAYDARVFDKAYNRLVRRPDPNLPREEKAKAIKEALAATKLDRSVMERTLPNLFNQKLASVWQDSAAGKTNFDKSEFVFLADFLNNKFQAGIPLDLPTDQLVSKTLSFMENMMPGVNPEMLGYSMEKQAGMGSAGCLMAVLSPADAAPIVKWIAENIPESALTGEGIEHGSHATIRYGFKPGLKPGELKKFLKSQPAVRFTLGKIRRFKGVWDGTADALVVDVESPDIVALHKAINSKFEKDLGASKWKTFSPHLTLAYVKPGAAKSVEEHANFDGKTYVLKSLVYSTAESKKKIDMPLAD